MREGFRIVDTDAHMMEPEWLWERHMEDAYKSQAPTMGPAPGSGRRTLILVRGVWPHHALPARVAIVPVPGLSLSPWYLLCPDLTLDSVEAVYTYAGRFQIEVNFDEIKELGLGHYQGRSGQGVRRWPLFLCIVHLLLNFVATGVLSVPLPELNWSWYPHENTVGQIRRRLIALCHPRISREKPPTFYEEELARAA
jgi:hypothetical protein